MLKLEPCTGIYTGHVNSITPKLACRKKQRAWENRNPYRTVESITHYCHPVKIALLDVLACAHDNNLELMAVECLPAYLHRRTIHAHSLYKDNPFSHLQSP